MYSLFFVTTEFSILIKPYASKVNSADFILKVKNIKRIIVPLNDTLSYLQALGFTYLVPGNIFTLDNLKSLQIDNISSDGLKGKTTIEEIVPSYLSKKNNKLDTYRKNAGR